MALQNHSFTFERKDVCFELFLRVIAFLGMVSGALVFAMLLLQRHTLAGSTPSIRRSP